METELISFPKDKVKAAARA
jgi:hypothetical protein